LLIHDSELLAATWGGGVLRLPLDLGGTPKKLASVEDRFTSLAKSGGEVFAGAQKGLFRIERNALTAVPSAQIPAPVFALAPAGDGELWVGGLVGLARVSARGTRIESSADVRAIAPGQSTVLVGTFGHGAFDIDRGRRTGVDGLSSAF